MPLTVEQLERALEDQQGRLDNLDSLIQGDGQLVLSGKRLVVDITTHLSDLNTQIESNAATLLSHNHGPDADGSYSGGGSAIDHGGLGGLLDDDHAQYLLLAGRGGQTIDDDITITDTHTIFVNYDGGNVIECANATPNNPSSYTLWAGGGSGGIGQPAGGEFIVQFNAVLGGTGSENSFIIDYGPVDYATSVHHYIFRSTGNVALLGDISVSTDFGGALGPGNIGIKFENTGSFNYRNNLNSSMGETLVAGFDPQGGVDRWRKNFSIEMDSFVQYKLNYSTAGWHGFDMNPSLSPTGTNYALVLIDALSDTLAGNETSRAGLRVFPPATTVGGYTLDYAAMIQLVGSPVVGTYNPSLFIGNSGSLVLSNQNTGSGPALKGIANYAGWDILYISPMTTDLKQWTIFMPAGTATSSQVSVMNGSGLFIAQYGYLDIQTTGATCNLLLREVSAPTPMTTMNIGGDATSALTDINFQFTGVTALEMNAGAGGGARFVVDPLFITDTDAAATTKNFYLLGMNYDSATETEGWTVIAGTGWDILGTNYNTLYFGGGIAGRNTASHIGFYCSANGQTLVGNEIWGINYDGSVTTYDIDLFADGIYITFGNGKRSHIGDTGTYLEIDCDLLAAGGRYLSVINGALRMQADTGEQAFAWTNENSRINCQGLTSGQASTFGFWNKDGDGTDNLGMYVWWVGTPTSFVNYEAGGMQYHVATATFRINSIAGGAGTVRPMSIYTGANTDQILLNIDGSVDLTTGNLTLVAGNLIIPDAGYIGSATTGDAIQIASTGVVTIKDTIISPAVKVTGISAERLVGTTAANFLSSIDLDNWIAGTANQITVTDDAAGGVVLSLPAAITLPGTLTLGGNLAIGAYYISNDGDNEGLSIDTNGVVTFSTHLTYAIDGAMIRADTSDGSDNQSFYVCGGGSNADTRGGYMALAGNEHGLAGDVIMYAGNVAGADIIFGTQATVRLRLEYDGNILTYGNWISNDGGSEGITIAANGDVTTSHGLKVGGTIAVNDSAIDSTAYIDVSETALDTTETQYGLFIDIAKTAGVTAAGDDLFGVYAKVDYNDSGQAYGSVIGGRFYAYQTDGAAAQDLLGVQAYVQMDAGTTGDDVMGARLTVAHLGGTVGDSLFGAYIEADMTGAGAVVSTNFYGAYIFADQNSGTISGDAFGLSIVADFDGTVTGTSYGLRVNSATGVDKPVYFDLPTEDLCFIDAGSVGATQQDWIEVEVGGNQGYIRVYASK